jgi:hypothetical protein
MVATYHPQSAAASSTSWVRNAPSSATMPDAARITTAWFNVIDVPITEFPAVDTTTTPKVRSPLSPRGEALVRP